MQMSGGHLLIPGWTGMTPYFLRSRKQSNPSISFSHTKVKPPSGSFFRWRRWKKDLTHVNADVRWTSAHSRLDGNDTILSAKQKAIKSLHYIFINQPQIQYLPYKKSTPHSGVLQTDKKASQSSPR